MSHFGSVETKAGSRIDPWRMSQFGGLAARRRISSQHLTDSGSTSKLVTWLAPIECAAYENTPLPQPMSMNVRPSSRSAPRKRAVCSRATAMRSGVSDRSTNSLQFWPNENVGTTTSLTEPSLRGARGSLGISHHDGAEALARRARRLDGAHGDDLGAGR